MNIFDRVIEIFKNLFGINGDGWVKRKNISKENIETCNGEALDDEISRTCALCVALNDTIFKNSNKPDYYHLHCKCKNISCDMPNVTYNFSIRKITNYLFVDKEKSSMMKSMGYTIEDTKEIYEIVKENAKKEYLKGSYKLKNLTVNGQKFQINFKLNGKRDHISQVFNCHIGCVAWPNGKILIATPIIQD